MDNHIIIYHAYCSDGLGAAWAFHHKMPNAVFHPAVHGSNPPDVTGKDVYMLDFAYSRDIVLDMKSKANSLIVLDHHKSKMEELGDLSFCFFDMTRSGAGIAWDYLFSKRHWLIDYTEDKDLWNWKLPLSREVNANLQSRPLTFDTLYSLEKLDPKSLWNRGEWKRFIAEGEAILRAQRNMVDDIIKKAREIEIQGYKVRCVNSPVLQSEVAGYLAHNRPFGVAWFENEAGERVYSLRSRPGGVDVSKIAAHYPGGGGHMASAGFRLKNGMNL